MGGEVGGAKLEPKDAFFHSEFQKQPGYLSTDCGKSHGSVGKFDCVPQKSDLQHCNNLFFHSFNITCPAEACGYMSPLGGFGMEM